MIKILRGSYLSLIVYDLDDQWGIEQLKLGLSLIKNLTRVLGRAQLGDQVLGDRALVDR